MKSADRTRSIGAKLRQAWNTALIAAETMSISPVEDLDDRVGRLERDVAMIKQQMPSVPLDVDKSIE